MADPRITRTQIHVMTTLRELIAQPGEVITFSTLAIAAKVSRRTLYTHWGTIESAVAEAAFGLDAVAERDTFTYVADDMMRRLPAVILELEQLRRERVVAA